VTVKKFSEITAWAKCVGCHNSQLTDPVARQSAPVGIDFNIYSSARTNAETAQHEVFEGEMPPAASAQLTAEEKDQIYNWASCDTPE
jgi:uncharacterized membrane protein